MNKKLGVDWERRMKEEGGRRKDGGGRRKDGGYHLLKEYRRMKNGKLKLVKVTKVKNAERVSFDQLLGNAMKFRVMEEMAEKAHNEAMFEALVDAASER